MYKLEMYILEYIHADLSTYNNAQEIMPMATAMAMAMAKSGLWIYGWNPSSPVEGRWEMGEAAGSSIAGRLYCWKAFMLE